MLMKTKRGKIIKRLIALLFVNNFFDNFFIVIFISKIHYA